MKTPPNNLVKVVRRVIDARANGQSWEQAARAVRRPITTVKCWRCRYRAFWDEEMAAARQEVADEAADQGVLVLRSLLVSKDERIRRDASSRLTALRPEPDAAATPNSEVVQLVQFLEGLTDVQLDTLLGPDDGANADRPPRDPVDAPAPPSAA